MFGQFDIWYVRGYMYEHNRYKHDIVGPVLSALLSVS